MLAASHVPFPIFDDFSTLIIISFLSIFSPSTHGVNVLISISMLSFSNFIFSCVKLIFHATFFISIVIMLFVSFDLMLIFKHVGELIMLSNVLIILNVQLTVDFFILVILSTFLLLRQHCFELHEVIERSLD